MGLSNKPREEREDVIYATILADGKIHVSVEEGTDGAVARMYATEEDKEEGPDVKTGKKWEHLYTEVSGVISKIDFHEGQYGINLMITIGEKDDDKPVTLALSTKGNYAEDLMKKLPGIDLKKPVTLSPYSFKDEKTKKMKRGMTVTQKDKKGKAEKLASFYHDEDKEPLHGFPESPKGKKGVKTPKSVWRKHFEVAREFLIADIIKRFDIKEKKAEGESDEDYASRKKALMTF